MIIEIATGFSITKWKPEEMGKNVFKNVLKENTKQPESLYLQKNNFRAFKKFYL